VTIKQAELPPELKNVVIAAASFVEQGAVLIRQGDEAQFTSYSPTYVDVEVEQRVPDGPWRDGPLPVDVDVIDDDGNAVGEILIWIKNGRIELFEQVWWTDYSPESWPDSDHIRAY